MSDKEKLQRAVENTIAAGYQLDSEAFAFLTSVAATQDPTALINKALLEIQDLEEKPFFIEKGFLQKFREQPQFEVEESCIQPPPEETTRAQMPQQTPEGTSLYQPYAKDIEPDLKIIDDPTTKLTSNGTIEDYLQYFQDRLKRLERLLRQRIDVKAATPILEALK